MGEFLSAITAMDVAKSVLSGCAIYVAFTVFFLMSNSDLLPTTKLAGCTVLIGAWILISAVDYWLTGNLPKQGGIARLLCAYAGFALAAVLHLLVLWRRARKL